MTASTPYFLRKASSKFGIGISEKHRRFDLLYEIKTPMLM